MTHSPGHVHAGLGRAAGGSAGRTGLHAVWAEAKAFDVRLVTHFELLLATIGLRFDCAADGIP